MNNKLNILGLVCGISLCCPSYADITGQYNCLTGNMSKGKILEGSITIAKENDQYTTQIAWSSDVNKSNLDKGILKPTTNASIFTENWEAKSQTSDLIGMSAWTFQGKNILIDFLYVNQTKGTVHNGQMSCTLKN